jgi:hypothetical protein
MSREAFKDIANYTRLPRPFLQILHRRGALHVRATPTLPPVVRVAARWLQKDSGIAKASTDEYISKKVKDEYLSKAPDKILQIFMRGVILTWGSQVLFSRLTPVETFYAMASPLPFISKPAACAPSCMDCGQN